MKARPIVTILAVLAFPAAASAWPASIHGRVTDLAVKLMPSSLSKQLTKHAQQLAAGAADGASSSCADHLLHADGSAGDLDARAEASAQRAIELIRSHGSFADIAFELGRLSHLLTDATNPLNTSASDPGEERYAADFGNYAAAKASRFPPIFNGYVLTEDFSVAAYTRDVAELANRSYPLVKRAYFPSAGGRMMPSSSFDDRDPVFAVAQLAFVRGVTATANVWLYVWREAHGDLSDTPQYSQRGSSKSERTTRASERK